MDKRKIKRGYKPFRSGLQQVIEAEAALHSVISMSYVKAIHVASLVQKADKNFL